MRYILQNSYPIAARSLPCVNADQSFSLELITMALDRFSEQQHELWARVEALWKMSVAQDAASVANALHPNYVGWVTGQPQPHGRDAAIASVGPSSPRVLTYKLQPLSIVLFDGTVGVVHYTYVAQVEDSGTNASKTVSGRWSEMYLRKDGQWSMISVSGGPDGER
ncbi:nuclear transport factor 2 family protein [Bradyrhizobium liaoningense]